MIFSVFQKNRVFGYSWSTRKLRFRWIRDLWSRAYRLFWHISRRFQIFALWMIFLVFQKNRVLGYSWSTLLWHRCYYPHRSGDAFSNKLDIYNYVGKLPEKHFSVWLFSHPGDNILFFLKFNEARILEWNLPKRPTMYVCLKIIGHFNLRDTLAIETTRAESSIRNFQKIGSTWKNPLQFRERCKKKHWICEHAHNFLGL